MIYIVCYGFARRRAAVPICLDIYIYGVKGAFCFGGFKANLEKCAASAGGGDFGGVI